MQLIKFKYTCLQAKELSEGSVTRKGMSFSCLFFVFLGFLRSEIVKTNQTPKINAQDSQDAQDVQDAQESQDTEEAQDDQDDPDAQDAQDAQDLPECKDP